MYRHTDILQMEAVLLCFPPHKVFPWKLFHKVSPIVLLLWFPHVCSSVSQTYIALIIVEW